MINKKIKYRILQISLPSLIFISTFLIYGYFKGNLIDSLKTILFMSIFLGALALILFLLYLWFDFTEKLIEKEVEQYG